MGDISQADPIAASIEWLRVDLPVIEEFDTEDAISGLNEPPYPHVRVSSSPGGDDGDLLWILRPEILVETYGDPDGSPGAAELRRLHYVVLASMRRMVTRTHTIDMPVVTNVVPASAALWSPLPLGQPRMVSALRLTIHPPRE